MAATQFGDLVKAVVDVTRRVMALGGELQSDEEAALLDDGAWQRDLWGINIYPADPRDEWIEFDSVINIRPSEGNLTRGVDNPSVRDAIRDVVDELIAE